MVLTRAEHFFDAWKVLVLGTLRSGPLLDLGTSQPYQKEMAVLRGVAPSPYFCLNVVASANVDLVGNGEHLPFRSESIGSIVCSHVLEHTERPDAMIEEMRRVLRRGCSAYMTFLDVYPYHARPGAYRDYHRFKRDAIGMLLRDWSSFTVLAGGGIGQIVVNYVPARLKRSVQVAANAIDRRLPTVATPVFYVSAQR
jgi:hypothetical protein